MAGNFLKRILTLIDANGVRVVEFSLSPGKSCAQHFHSHILEYCYCLQGQLSVDINDKQSTVVLNPGEKVEIAPRVVHSLRNETHQVSRYLVVQGVGEYDFVEV